MEAVRIGAYGECKHFFVLVYEVFVVAGSVTL